jgi:hypothetical protein
MRQPLYTDPPRLRPGTAALLALLAMAISLPGSERMPAIILAALPGGVSLALLAWACHLSRTNSARFCALLCSAAILAALYGAAAVESPPGGSRILLAVKCAACALAAAGIAIATRSPRSWH